MRSGKLALLPILALACCVSCGVAKPPANTSGLRDPVAAEKPAALPGEDGEGPLFFWNLSDVDKESAVTKLFDAMSAEQKLSQLFMVTYYGTQPSAGFLTWIRTRGVGGVKIFGWNADSTETLVQSLRIIYKTADTASLGIPPFVATDQEGGWIRHIKGATSITPGNMAIGASGWIDDSYQSGYYINRELFRLGVLMNFAPTVDLATKPESPIIGPRAFSDDPMKTAVLAAAWMQGALKAGVLPVAKHFPGHGDTVYDAHGTLPVIDISPETLWSRELVPYKLLVKEGLPGIMSGHLAYPQVTGNREAASLSKTIISGILRERLGFEGIVITDDLAMQGALTEGGLEEACERAIEAGNDMILISKELEPDGFLWQKLKQRYLNDAAFRSRVDESVRRVLLAKLTYIVPAGRDYLLALPSDGKNLSDEAEKDFFLEQAGRSLTGIGSKEFVPLKDSQRLLAVGQFSDFYSECRKYLPLARQLKISYLPEWTVVDTEWAAFKAALPGADTVLVCVANAASARYAEEALRNGKRVYVLSVLNPWHVRDCIDKAVIVAVYSFARESIMTGLLALKGEIPVFGTLPADLRK